MKNDQGFKMAIGEMFTYISDVATAIRMNSAYNQKIGNNEFSACDVMWLSDSLHNFNMLGKALIENQDVKDSVERLISIFRSYMQGGSNSDASGTYERWSRYNIHPDQGIKVLEKIRDSYQKAM